MQLTASLSFFLVQYIGGGERVLKEETNFKAKEVFLGSHWNTISFKFFLEVLYCLEKRTNILLPLLLTQDHHKTISNKFKIVINFTCICIGSKNLHFSIACDLLSILKKEKKNKWGWREEERKGWSYKLQNLRKIIPLAAKFKFQIEKESKLTLKNNTFIWR